MGLKTVVGMINEALTVVLDKGYIDGRPWVGTCYEVWPGVSLECEGSVQVVGFTVTSGREEWSVMVAFRDVYGSRECRNCLFMGVLRSEWVERTFQVRFEILIM